MKNTEIQERILRPAHGIPVLILELVLIAVSLLLMIGGVVLLNWSPVFGVAAIVVGPILLIADCICFAGLKSVRPNEALVLTLFGSYHGTVKEPGFYFVNPFCSAVSPAYDKAAAEAMKKAKEADSHSERLDAGGGLRAPPRFAQDYDAGQRPAEGERRAGQPHHHRRCGHLARSGPDAGGVLRGGLPVLPVTSRRTRPSATSRGCIPMTSSTEDEDAAASEKSLRGSSPGDS